MREILKKITADKNLEARWLNTLSLLEFIGARKICRSVCENHPQSFVLEHFADESRHAHAFKKMHDNLVSTINQDRFSSDNSYLCHDQAVSYFQMLDQLVNEKIQEAKLEKAQFINYLLVTHLIEKRAMLVYPLYSHLTQYSDIKNQLDQIIQEEASHRSFVKEQIQKALKQQNQIGFIEICESIEEQLFFSFEQSLKKELSFKKAA